MLQRCLRRCRHRCLWHCKQSGRRQRDMQKTSALWIRADSETVSHLMWMMLSRLYISAQMSSMRHMWNTVTKPHTRRARRISCEMRRRITGIIIDRFWRRRSKPNKSKSLLCTYEGHPMQIGCFFLCRIFLYFFIFWHFS